MAEDFFDRIRDVMGMVLLCCVSRLLDRAQGGDADWERWIPRKNAKTRRRDFNMRLQSTVVTTKRSVQYCFRAHCDGASIAVLLVGEGKLG